MLYLFLTDEPNISWYMSIAAFWSKECLKLPMPVHLFIHSNVNISCIYLEGEKEEANEWWQLLLAPWAAGNSQGFCCHSAIGCSIGNVKLNLSVSSH